MKTIYKFLLLGILMMAFTAVTVTPTFAQTPEQEEKVALYKKYTDNFDKPEIEKKKIAIEAGKQYIEKYGAKEEDKDQVNYLKTAVPALETQVIELEKIAKEKALQKIKTERFNRFDKSVRENNVADAFSVGKEVIANEPADSMITLDVEIVLASLGYDQAVKKVDTYNNDALNFSKTVIQKLNAGKATKNFGAYQYEYKTKDNALGWMNYTIGYINYYRQDKKVDALPYLYKATQLSSDTKKFSDIYRIIGSWYLDEAVRIDKERTDKITAASGKDTDETLALFALQRGYADRAIDGYGRAYKIALDNPKATKEYKDALYSRLQDLFKFRFDGDVKGIDPYISTVMSKTMPDPSTPVTPVATEDAATSTASTPGTKPMDKAMDKPMEKSMDKSMEKPMEKPATTKPATTKPNATPTKPVSTTTTTNIDSSTQATATTKKAKTTTKKPVTKKKPTR